MTSLFQHWSIKEALITIKLLIGATLLIFYIRKIYLSKKYHLKELKALGFYQENTKEIKNEKTGLKDKRVSSSIKVYWSKNLLVFKKYNRAFGIADFEAKKGNLETLFNTKIELISSKVWNIKVRIPAIRSICIKSNLSGIVIRTIHRW